MPTDHNGNNTVGLQKDDRAILDYFSIGPTGALQLTGDLNVSGTLETTVLDASTEIESADIPDNLEFDTLSGVTNTLTLASNDLSRKVLVNNTSIQIEGPTAKRVNLDVSNVTDSTTRTFSFLDENMTPVGISNTQSINNKSFTGVNFADEWRAINASGINIKSADTTNNVKVENSQITINSNVVDITADGGAYNKTGTASGNLLKWGTTPGATNPSGVLVLDGTGVPISAVKNDAFNKTFGTGTGQVLQGNTEIDMNSKKIINLAPPVAGTDATNKNYVDNLASGLNPLQPCKMAFVGTVVSNSDISTLDTVTDNTLECTLAVADTLSIDGVAASLNDRVLVWNQANDRENGVYEITTFTGTSLILTRDSDMDSATPVVYSGSSLYIDQGVTIGQNIMVLTSNDTSNISGLTGDDILFTKFSGNNPFDQPLNTTDTVTFGKVVVDQMNMDLSTLTLNGTSGFNKISFPTSQAEGLIIQDIPGTKYVRFDSTNETIYIDKKIHEVTIESGYSVTTTAGGNFNILSSNGSHRMITSDNDINFLGTVKLNNEKLYNYLEPTTNQHVNVKVPSSGAPFRSTTIDNGYPNSTIENIMPLYSDIFMVHQRSHTATTPEHRFKTYHITENGPELLSNLLYATGGDYSTFGYAKVENYMIFLHFNVGVFSVVNIHDPRNISWDYTNIPDPGTGGAATALMYDRGFLYLVFNNGHIYQYVVDFIGGTNNHLTQIGGLALTSPVSISPRKSFMVNSHLVLFDNANSRTYNAINLDTFSQLGTVHTLPNEAPGHPNVGVTAISNDSNIFLGNDSQARHNHWLYGYVIAGSTGADLNKVIRINLKNLSLPTVDKFSANTYGACLRAMHHGNLISLVCESGAGTTYLLNEDLTEVATLGNDLATEAILFNNTLMTHKNTGGIIYEYNVNGLRQVTADIGHLNLNECNIMRGLHCRELGTFGTLSTMGIQASNMMTDTLFSAAGVKQDLRKNANGIGVFFSGVGTAFTPVTGTGGNNIFPPPGGGNLINISTVNMSINASTGITTINVSGKYLVNWNATIKPSNDGQIGEVYLNINGGNLANGMASYEKMNDRRTCLSGSGLFGLGVGDTLKLNLLVSTTHDVTVYSASVSLMRLGDAN